MKILGVSIIALAFFASACKGKDDGGGDEPTAAAEPEPSGEKAKEPAAADKPGKPIVACDQRDFISKMEKDMAARLDKEPRPKRVCIDYTERSKDLPGSPSCAQGKPLETGCPDDGVVATCTMTTGVVFKHYEGGDVSTGKRMCKTMEGTFAESK